MDYWIWYATIKINAYTKLRLLEHYNEPEKIFNLTENEFFKWQYSSAEVYKAICNNKNKETIVKMQEYMKKKNIKYITIYDKEYPESLKNIYDPPVLLFYIGNIKLINNKSISIVGSRNPSSYGIRAAYNISNELSSKYTIVSGLARGIDACAHSGALKSNSNTIAVLGCGVDIAYPNENIKIYNEILKRGLIISEYPVGEKPFPSNFPARNRIVSGLSEGVIVVEAAPKSGTLITVDFALEQGKNIYAVPGNIDSYLSLGTNELIKNGAIPYTCIDDILE